jgi:shikimate dehydrogenase
MIDGKTKLIPHIGYPTESFKAPMIYNPWFESRGINAIVAPFAVQGADFPDVLKSLFRCGNVIGALITMPHKVAVTKLVDELTVTAKIAGAANAVVRRPDGSLVGDMFDGEGFARGVLRKGQEIKGKKVLVVGSGGVGCAIAASLAAAGAAEMGLFDPAIASAQGLADRLTTHYPALKVSVGSKDPAGFDIVVNATPLGMKAGDPLPMDVERIAPTTFVGEVVMKEEHTPFLRAAIERGCRTQVGTDMLFEMIPAYLEFFGFGSTTAEELRAIARLQY